MVSIFSNNFFISTGSWEWNQFVRDHSFDFLGASGNAEVKEAPEYGECDLHRIRCKLVVIVDCCFLRLTSTINDTKRECRDLG